MDLNDPEDLILTRPLRPGTERDRRALASYIGWCMNEMYGYTDNPSILN